MSMIGYFTRIKRGKMEEIINSPELLPDILFVGKNPKLEIDKSWHGIHFLLTGSSWGGDPPLSYAVLGGHPLESKEFEWDYGSPQYKTPEEVRQVYQVLSKLSLDELKNQYDPDKFWEADIYPHIWGEEGEDLEYLLSYLKDIIDFYKAAVENDEAIIFWLC